MASDEVEDCPICIQPLSRWKTYQLVCGHVYHEKCIDCWVQTKKKSSCPICRHPVKKTPKVPPKKSLLSRLWNIPWSEHSLRFIMIIAHTWFSLYASQKLGTDIFFLDIIFS